MKSYPILVQIGSCFLLLLGGFLLLSPTSLNAQEKSEEKRLETRHESPRSRPFDPERFFFRFLRNQLDREDRDGWRNDRERRDGRKPDDRRIRPDRGDDESSPGYVRSSRARWDAWHDVQPGTSAPRLHIEGQVTVSSGNYHAELRRRISTANSLHYKVVVKKSAGYGTQALTARKIDFSRRYRGNHEEVIIHLPDGEQYVLPIRKAR